MDPFTLAIVILIIVLIVVIIAIAIFKKSTGPSKAERCGKKGENSVNYKLLPALGPHDYMLNNLLVKARDNFEVEIDTVIVSTRGIFSIEIKNWKGRIEGDDYSDKWVQTKYYDKKIVREHLNPVKQNETHVKALEIVLKHRYDVQNIVILTGYDRNYVNSLYLYDTSTFKRYFLNKKEILHEEEVKEIYAKLIEYKATEEELKIYATKVRNKH